MIGPEERTKVSLKFDDMGKPRIRIFTRKLQSPEENILKHELKTNESIYIQVYF